MLKFHPFGMLIGFLYGVFSTKFFLYLGFSKLVAVLMTVGIPLGFLVTFGIGFSIYLHIQKGRHDSH